MKFVRSDFVGMYFISNEVEEGSKIGRIGGRQFFTSVSEMVELMKTFQGNIEWDWNNIEQLVKDAVTISEFENYQEFKMAHAEYLI